MFIDITMNSLTVHPNIHKHSTFYDIKIDAPVEVRVGQKLVH